MCFGLVASFTSSIALATIGIATLKKVTRRKQILFASIPLIFSLHQLIEGFLWVILRSGSYSYLQHLLTLVFLMFALCLWPIYVPASVFLLESQRSRRRFLLFITILGALLSALLLYHLLSGIWVASILNCSISYLFTAPGPDVPITLIYLFIIVGPYFLSSEPWIVAFGLLNLLSCGMAAYMYYTVFVSTWCFFAALLSIMICFYVGPCHAKDLPKDRRY